MASTPAALPQAAGPLPEPLRLPHGSVRGLLSVFLLVTFGVLLLRGGGVIATPPVFVNSVVVVLAFFFGSHPPPAPSQPGLPQPQAPHPPRFLRALLVVGFGGLALWFISRNLASPSLPPELTQIWEVLAGYLVGMTASWYFHRHVHERLSSRKLATLFRDASAAAVLLLTAFICAAYILDLAGTLANRLEQVLSLVITYYFGARVLAR